MVPVWLAVAGRRGSYAPQSVFYRFMEATRLDELLGVQVSGLFILDWYEAALL